MSMTLATYATTENGKTAANLSREYLDRETIPAAECFTYAVLSMVDCTIFDCEESGYDDWEIDDAVAAMPGEMFFAGIIDWIQNAQESADILSLTADDARYDGLVSLFDWLEEFAKPHHADPNRVETTEKYWDCECESDYIHPATQTHCDLCGCDKDDCPDSRVNEVREKGLPL